MREVEEEKKQLWILLPSMEELQQVREELNNILRSSPGRTQVYIQLKDEKKGLAARNTVHVDDALLSKLRLEYGADSVLVREKK